MNLQQRKIHGVELILAFVIVFTFVFVGIDFFWRTGLWRTSNHLWHCFRDQPRLRDGRIFLQLQVHHQIWACQGTSQKIRRNIEFWLQVLIAGLLGNLIRFLYISFITWPWLVLPFEFLQGMSDLHSIWILFDQAYVGVPFPFISAQRPFCLKCQSVNKKLPVLTSTNLNCSGITHAVV